MSLSRFPSLDAYLARLPDGLASFPHARCKASLLTNLLDERRLPPGAIGALPAACQEYFVTAPPVTAWIPETHLVAVMLAHLDEVFEGREAELVRCQWLSPRVVARTSAAALSAAIDVAGGRDTRVVAVAVGPDRVGLHFSWS